MQMRNDTAGFVQVLLRDLGGVRPLSATISVLLNFGSSISLGKWFQGLLNLRAAILRDILFSRLESVF